MDDSCYNSCENHKTLQKATQDKHLLCIYSQTILSEIQRSQSSQPVKSSNIITLILSSLFLQNRRMCTTKQFKSRDCDHKWLEIDTPCGYGKGFSTCSSFHCGTRARAAAYPKFYSATKDDCPWHGLKGNYGFNCIRMVERSRYRICLLDNRATVSAVICCAIM